MVVLRSFRGFVAPELKRKPLWRDFEFAESHLKICNCCRNAVHISANRHNDTQHFQGQWQRIIAADFSRFSSEYEHFQTPRSFKGRQNCAVAIYS